MYTPEVLKRACDGKTKCRGGLNLPEIRTYLNITGGTRRDVLVQLDQKLKDDLKNKTKKKSDRTQMKKTPDDDDKSGTSWTRAWASAAAYSGQKMMMMMGYNEPDKKVTGKSRLKVVTEEWEGKTTLGKEGKEGIVFEVTKGSTGRRYAMKQFKPRKSRSKFDTEVRMQRAAHAAGAAPEVIEVLHTVPLRLVMERMDCTVVDVIREQNGMLTEEQQLDIIKVHDRLDEAQIYHNDPNPLNLMCQKLSDGRMRWLLVDYGFAKPVDSDRHGSRPNRESIEFLLNGAYQGLNKTGVLTQEAKLLAGMNKRVSDIW
tara:strand:+ start:1334 stop:2275 length:942 start_codon:yes stop_codon:yes gene_type:complete